MTAGKQNPDKNQIVGICNKDSGYLFLGSNPKNQKPFGFPKGFFDVRMNKLHQTKRNTEIIHKTKTVLKKANFFLQNVTGTLPVLLHRLIPRIVDNPVEKWITFYEKTLILHKETLNLHQNYSYITIRKKHLPKSLRPDIIGHAK